MVADRPLDTDEIDKNMKRFRKVLKDDSGLVAIEYALICAGMALANLLNLIHVYCVETCVVAIIMGLVGYLVYKII